MKTDKIVQEQEIRISKKKKKSRVKAMKKSAKWIHS